MSTCSWCNSRNHTRSQCDEDPLPLLGIGPALETHMQIVTLYEYTGETRHESGVAKNWEQVGEPVTFDPREMHWTEALLDVFAANDLPGDWDTNYRADKRTMVYEAHNDHSPVYRAEVSSK